METDVVQQVAIVTLLQDKKQKANESGGEKLAGDMFNTKFGILSAVVSTLTKMNHCPTAPSDDGDLSG